MDSSSLFTKIYQESYDTVLKYIICHCRNIEDANEILQETYLSFYRALEKGTVIENIESYLLGIARNKIRRHYTLFYRIQTVSLFSKLKNQEETELQDVLADETDIERELMMQFELEEVWELLKKKKPVVQKVFMLYYYFEMTHREIAEALSLNESTVKNYLYRGLKELRKELSQDVHKR